MFQIIGGVCWLLLACKLIFVEGYQPHGLIILCAFIYSGITLIISGLTVISGLTDGMTV